MTTLTDDQRRRHAEFQQLFSKMPGKKNVDRLHVTAMVTKLSIGTLRQYRMAEPPRVPSEQALELMRQFLGSAA